MAALQLTTSPIIFPDWAAAQAKASENGLGEPTLQSDGTVTADDADGQSHLLGSMRAPPPPSAGGLLPGLDPVAAFGAMNKLRWYWWVIAGVVLGVVIGRRG